MDDKHLDIVYALVHADNEEEAKLSSDNVGYKLVKSEIFADYFPEANASKPLNITTKDGNVLYRNIGSMVYSREKDCLKDIREIMAVNSVKQICEGNPYAVHSTTERRFSEAIYLLTLPTRAVAFNEAGDAIWNYWEYLRYSMIPQEKPTWIVCLTIKRI